VSLSFSCVFPRALGDKKNRKEVLMPAPALVFGVAAVVTSMVAHICKEEGQARRAKKVGHPKRARLVKFTCDVTDEDEAELEASGGMDAFLRMANRGRYIEHGE
jgi:hypothetical protein